MVPWSPLIALVSRGAVAVARCCRQIGWRALPFLIGLPAWPATGSPAEPAGRLDRAHAQLIQAFASADPQACRNLRAEFERDPPQDWSHMAFLVWNGLTGCESLPGGPWTRMPPSAEAIRQAWQPAFSHFGRMPTELRLKNDQTVDLLVHYWATHRGFFSPALAAVADAEEAAQLDDWYQRAAQTPPDALAVASLTRLGQAVYGMRWLAGWMQTQQQRLEATLGPGHEATLHMLRARIFAARAHERPAEAVALSDDYAARAARYQPNDERLAMLNRSERIGALAGVGRLADAIDEGRLLLAWLQARQPPQPGNVMRTAYNLAGTALAMGDAEAAESFARLSIEQAERSNSHDRGESIVARWLLLQARLQSGDDSAGPALKVLLKGVVSWDLPAIDPLLSLHQWARRTGDVEAERWATDQIERVTVDRSSSLQGARALPWVLQAETAATAGRPGQHAAALALAHGLAADARVMEVRPALALARQVAPQQPAGAAWLCKRAAQALVDWRQGLPEQQAGQPRQWLSEHEAGLRQCIGLLFDQGRLGEAEQLMAVLREEELHEFRRRSRGPTAQASRPLAIGLTSDERGRNARVAPVQAQLRREAAAARARADAQADHRQRVGGHDDAAEVVAGQAALALQNLGLQAPAAAPAREGLPQGRPNSPARQARVAYLLAARPGGDLSAIVDAGGRRQHVVLPVDNIRLSRAVAELRAAMSDPAAAGVPAAAQRLYEWLVRPLIPALGAARHLSIVPDGVLRYLPFAALHDGDRYLVERYGLSLQLTPQGGMGESLRPPRKRPLVAAFGRSLPTTTHSALPGVADELNTVRRLPGAEVRLALDQQFTRRELVEALQRQPQVVHLASHFVLAPASEEDSYLLLGDGARLSLRELRQLPWQGVRLALLSSCDSALPLDPDSAAQGREWAGFAAALQRAGVRDVLATLWRIDDTSAARWMSGFYTQWARAAAAGGVDASVLTRTQRAWLREHRNAELGHPRHWAAFVWIASS